MKIAVIGTGYVGLVAGACFSDFGNDVTCCDIDENKISMLKNGEIPIYEPGLEPIVHRNVEAGRLHFTTDVYQGVKGAKVVFMAVGTPMGEDGRANLTYLKQAAKMVAEGIDGFTVIVDKSTVPVGTADMLRDYMSDFTSHEVVVASNPEFLKEGDAVNDFMKPERVIIGTTDERARKLLHELYKPFVRSRDRIIDMDARSAELTKYAANAMLATRISFMNEIARFCEMVGADVELVRKGVGSDSRIGPKFLYPGIGYGGSCFPKDVSALILQGKDAGYDFQVVRATQQVNADQKKVLVDKVKARFGDDLSGRTIGVLGLAFKPNTDDIREAPAHVIVEGLLAAGATVKAYDPVAMDNFKSQHPENDRLSYVGDMYEAATDADALLLCTEWHEFQRPDFARLREIMAGNVLLDGRNVWNTTEVAELGFDYEGIGRKTPVARS